LWPTRASRRTSPGARPRSSLRAGCVRPAGARAVARSRGARRDAAVARPRLGRGVEAVEPVELRGDGRVGELRLEVAPEGRRALPRLARREGLELRRVVGPQLEVLGEDVADVQRLDAARPGVDELLDDGGEPRAARHARRAVERRGHAGGTGSGRAHLTAATKILI
jgi:hypothetical protein